MKKLIPYIISYLIVATCTAIYPHIYMHFARKATITFPADTVAVISTSGLSHAELDAKLQQVGLSEAHPHSVPFRPAPLHFSFVEHYVFEAVVLSAFTGLVILFRRAFRADVPI